MSAVDEVKQKTDIVEVIGQYTALKKAGRNMTALCPFHSEKHPSFFVYPEQQSWHCFGACNTGGDVFAFIMRKEGMDFTEALHMLAQKAGVTLPSRTRRESDKDEKEELYRINEAAALYFHNLLIHSPAAEKALSYVQKRGFTWQTVADFQLGFSLDSWEALKQYLMEKGCNENVMLTSGLIIQAENAKTYDRFRGKLMFPIRDIKGRTIGFGARVLDDSLPKYVNSPQSPTFDKSGSLYGIDRAARDIRQQDRAIIVEGYMDVITAHQNGITNVVASMGTSVTETQVNTLKKLSRNLMLALDADTAGEEAMLRGISYENALNAEIKIVILPEGKDPDDVIREDIKVWEGLVTRALPIVDYTFGKVVAKLDMTVARDKSLAAEKLVPVVAEIKNPVRQAHYLQKLARLIGVSEKTMEMSLIKVKPTPVRSKVPESKPRTSGHILRPLASDPREEYCLALVLQHPELKDGLGALMPHYFENSENREIFTAWQETGGLPSLKERLDPALHEHLDAIIKRDLPAGQTESKLVDCIRELEKQYYRRFEARRAEALALEAEAGGTGADLARLQEEGIEPSTRLKEIYTYKSQKRT